MISAFQYLGRKTKRAILLWDTLSRAAVDRGVWAALFDAVSMLRRDGMRGLRRTLNKANRTGSDFTTTETGDVVSSNDYTEWVRRYGVISKKDEAQMKRRLVRWAHQPKISIVLSTQHPNLSRLRATVNSVCNQIYGKWQLFIADSCCEEPRVREFLAQCSTLDERIKIFTSSAGGDSCEDSNNILEAAEGEWATFLDQGDLLAKDALIRVAETIVTRPETGLIYSDEDETDDADNWFNPKFKPDWNPDLFRSTNVISRLCVFRLDIVKMLGGLRKGFNGSEEYDLALRCAEVLNSSQILHLPRVLYHRLSQSGRAAQIDGSTERASLAGKRALDEHLARMRIKGHVDVIEPGMFRVRYDECVPAPLVSLIIPTRNGLALLKQCVESILEKTLYANYEILIVDNNSDDEDTINYLTNIVKDQRIRVILDERPFNYSALNNNAVKQAHGAYIGLINNDIEVISPDWLNEIMRLACQKGVGAVGARLWYPDNSLQHGGIILGLGGVAGHSHKHLPKGYSGHSNRAKLIQTVSAVTAACLIVRRSIYEEVGGLDEENLKIAFNDVDFCLKVREAGYRNIWTPYAELYHHESATRGVEDTPEKKRRFRSEILYMKRRWRQLLSNDPAYNPNLTLDYEDFSLAWPPRVQSGKSN